MRRRFTFTFKEMVGHKAVLNRAIIPDLTYGEANGIEPSDRPVL